jgi:hypothetical protein
VNRKEVVDQYLTQVEGESTRSTSKSTSDYSNNLLDQALEKGRFGS